MTELNQELSLDALMNKYLPGKVVRKDLTKLIKEGANVPVYVLEYLLGMYCASDDTATIEAGLTNVKRVLAENYVRPDEAEKVKSKIRESGSYKVIDKITVKLNEKRDTYEALLSNLGIKDAEIPDSYVKNFEKLLVGGICLGSPAKERQTKLQPSSIAMVQMSMAGRSFIWPLLAFEPKSAVAENCPLVNP